MGNLIVQQIVALCMATVIAGVSDIKATCTADRCICPRATACVSGLNIRDGLQNGCHKGIYGDFRLVSGFSKACRQCTCEPAVTLLTTACNSGKAHLPNTISADWIVAHCPESSDAASGLAFKGQRKGQAVEEQPWVALCDLDRDDRIPHKDVLTRVSFYSQDQRLAVWMSQRMLARTEVAELVTRWFDYDSLHPMTTRGMYVLAVYIYDVSTTDPVMVLHPTRYLNIACQLHDREYTAPSTQAVINVLGDRVAHAHYRDLKGFIAMYTGTPVKQVPPTMDALMLRQDGGCCSVAASEPKVFTPNKPVVAPTLTAIIPAYPGHLQYLNESIRRQQVSTEQPDQIIVGASEMNPTYAKQVLFTLPDPHGTNRLVVVARNVKQRAGPNRNIAAALSRMELTASIDADDLPHPQRNEVVRRFYRDHTYALLAHRFVRWPVQLKLHCLPCLNSTDDIGPETYIDDLALHMTANHTRGPGYLDMKVEGKTRWFAHHGATCFQTKYFREVKWPDTYPGQDLQFDQKIVLLGERFNVTSYLLGQKLMFYINARSASFDKRN